MLAFLRLKTRQWKYFMNYFLKKFPTFAFYFSELNTNPVNYSKYGKSESTVEVTEISIEEKLRALNNLQAVDSQVDRIKTLRGELP